MLKKNTNITFVVMFILMCSVPLMFSNLVHGTPSVAENRMLHGIAKVFKWDGSLNKDVLNEFDGWIDDNIGFRSEIVALNAKIQFYIFNRFTHNSNLCMGPDGIINRGAENEIRQYQHLDLKSKEELEEIAGSFQKISDYLKSNGIQYYYMPLYEKYSIYPEHMPEYIIQYGDVSRIDQIVEVLKEKTDINLVLLKEKLIEAKKEYRSYSEYGDPTHWTDRGAYIGYSELMKLINNNGNAFRILEEEDYNITIQDKGETLFGGIKLVDYMEDFELKNLNAVEVREDLGEYAEDSQFAYYRNDKVENKTRALLFTDSYIRFYLLDEFSETFHEVIWIHADRMSDFEKYIDQFKPDIVIHENAECTDRYDSLKKIAEGL